ALRQACQEPRTGHPASTGDMELGRHQRIRGPVAGHGPSPPGGDGDHRLGPVKCAHTPPAGWRPARSPNVTNGSHSKPGSFLGDVTDFTASLAARRGGVLAVRARVVCQKRPVGRWHRTVQRQGEELEGARGVAGPGYAPAAASVSRGSSFRTSAQVKPT